ncbi:MAG: GTPase [Acidimicrobiales bacterium]
MTDPTLRRRVVVAGAGGRDFHDFATVLRDDPAVEVVAFTAAQIPGIDHRTFPAALAGPRYPDGIPVHPEADLAALVARHGVDEVILSYSDLPHVEVMHRASIALAAGASFRLLAPQRSFLSLDRPVVAVTATRTGAGKSQTSRRIGRLLLDAGLRVALVRHPMPYGDLTAMAVQRFATLDELDAAAPTIEEREEYEEPIRQGFVVHTGVDYAAVGRAAAAEADVVVWDGGNNDTPFFTPALWITVLDALRPDHGLGYHPGEVNLRRADVVVVNKLDSAPAGALEAALAGIETVNPRATVVLADSPVTLDPGPTLAGRRVLVVEDGPSLTHGGMPFGAGTVAARAAGATELLDPRPYAAGSIAQVYAAHLHLGPVLPAMGYGAEQVEDLAATIAAAAPDVVVTGTPIGLEHVLARAGGQLGVPVRRARYELRERQHPDLRDVLAPYLAGWGARA